MAREPRIVVPHIPHHVVLRGNNRRFLFTTRDDYSMFVFFVGLALDKSQCALHVMTLMSNHAHLLLTPPTEDSLSECVKSLAQRYAQLRNKKRDASGRLFEEGFYSQPISAEQEAVVTSHIHSNPVRMGIASDALEFPWSTHAQHAGAPERSAIPPTVWTPANWFLSLAGNPWRRGERYLEIYDEHLHRGAEPENVEQLKELEAISLPYTRRVRRPDGCLAREDVVRYEPLGHCSKIPK